MLSYETAEMDIPKLFPTDGSFHEALASGVSWAESLVSIWEALV